MAWKQDGRELHRLDWAAGQFAARGRRGQPDSGCGLRHWRGNDRLKLCFARCAISRGKPHPLRALEARAVERGNTQCTLISTETARRFYLSNGYEETGLLSGA